MCRISVVTSVYNAERYIGDTIQSVINQTYKDWEYIIIDDCSTDKSSEIIQRYADSDSRIVFIKNEENCGQCANLNKGISTARGEYIARLDHDDLCDPMRFEKQLEYMESNRDVEIVGCCMKELKKGKLRMYDSDMKIESREEARFYALFGSPMAHSSFFIRKSAMTGNDVWYGEFDYAEDYALICDVLSIGNIFKLNEALITYRTFPEQTTQTVGRRKKTDEGIRIREIYLKNTGYKDSGVLSDANKGLLNGYKNYKKFECEMVKFAQYCGICGENINNNPCIKHAYIVSMIRQRGGIGMIFAYATSPLRYRRWMTKSLGIKIIIKGLLGGIM